MWAHVHSFSLIVYDSNAHCFLILHFSVLAKHFHLR